MAAATDRVEIPTEERILATARALLEEEGVEALTLRRVARAAGLSHGAPLRHFASLAVLRAELAAEGFRRLSEGVEGAASALPAGAGPLARLAAAGRAYVACAVASPGVFALMFRPELLDLEHPSFQRDSRQAFEQLLRRVRAAQDAGWRAGRDTGVLAASVWAAVHGTATLWSQGALPGAVPQASLEDVVSTTIELALGAPSGGTP